MHEYSWEFNQETTAEPDVPRQKNPEDSEGPQQTSLVVPIRGLWLILGTVVVFSILPFVFLAYYCQPATDDFQVAFNVHEDGFWNAQRMWYRQLTGRYINTAILSLLAGYVDLNALYWVVPLYLLLGLFFASWNLFTRLNRWLPRPGSKPHLLLAALLFVSIFLVSMPSPADGLYWLSGAHSYVGVGIIAMFCGACLVPPVQPETKGRAFFRFMVAGLLAVAAVGSNETMLVLLGSLLTVATIGCFLHRTEFRYYWLMVLIMAGCSASVVLLCPGNKRRLEFERLNHEYDLLRSLLGDLTFSLEMIANLFSSPAMIASLALWLVVVRYQITDSRKASFNASRYAWGTPLILMAILALASFPAWWALGSAPPLRTQNMLHLYCMLMVFFATAYWVVMAGPIRTRWLMRSPQFMLGLAILLACSILVTSQLRMAWNDWLRFADGYAQQHQFRLALIQQAKETGEFRIRFPRLRNVPLTIHAWDVSPDPKHWSNVGAARYYRVGEIWKLPSEAPMEDDEPDFKMLQP